MSEQETVLMGLRVLAYPSRETSGTPLGPRSVMGNHGGCGESSDHWPFGHLGLAEWRVPGRGPGLHWGGGSRSAVPPARGHTRRACGKSRLEGAPPVRWTPQDREGGGRDASRRRMSCRALPDVEKPRPVHSTALRATLPASL